MEGSPCDAASYDVDDVFFGTRGAGPARFGDTALGAKRCLGFFSPTALAMGSLPNIDFGVCWASWGGSGKKGVPGKFREGSGKVPGTVPGKFREGSGKVPGTVPGTGWARGSRNRFQGSKVWMGSRPRGTRNRFQGSKVWMGSRQVPGQFREPFREPVGLEVPGTGSKVPRFGWVPGLEVPGTGSKVPRFGWVPGLEVPGTGSKVPRFGWVPGKFRDSSGNRSGNRLGSRFQEPVPRFQGLDGFQASRFQEPVPRFQGLDGFQASRFQEPVPRFEWVPGLEVPGTGSGNCAGNRLGSRFQEPVPRLQGLDRFPGSRFQEPVPRLG